MKNRVWKKFKAWVNGFEEKAPVAAPIVFRVIIALVVTVIVEMLSRRSVWGTVKFIFQSPFAFLYNAVLINATLLLALLVPKRKATTGVIAGIWLGLGVADFILLCFRTTPLAAIDFLLAKSVRTIFTVYLNLFEVILIIVAFILCGVAIFFAYKKTGKKKVQWLHHGNTIILSAILVAVMTLLGLKMGWLSKTFTNLGQDYKRYGFAYCFSVGVIDRGVDEPQEYSEEGMDEILTAIRTDSEFKNEERPNIIFVQLESFYDLNTMKDIIYSEDPVPNFSRIRKEYDSGLVTVPSIGAGTANTEFEVLTGMSLDYFGTGEYPYKTILQDHTCESIAYNLKELGYSTHAIHNHSGSFYDRYKVYMNLGFDTFTSREYMQNVEVNDLNWAYDKVLTDEVIKALDSSYGQDFVYAITVQPHGKYPTVEDPAWPIKLSGTFPDGWNVPGFAYFANQLHDSDAFVGELLKKLEQRDEPVMVVFFGDHLPSLDIREEQLEGAGLMQTEYVIWDNYMDHSKPVHRDLSAYQLSAYALQKAGINNGILTKLHQRYATNSHYEQALEMLEYDMLYGDQDVYGGQPGYEPTPLHMGVDEITISTVHLSEEKVPFIYGNNFTRWSSIFVNDKEVATILYDSHTLIASDTKLHEGDVVTVRQAGPDALVLSSTEPYIYHREAQ